MAEKFVTNAIRMSKGGGVRMNEYDGDDDDDDDEVGRGMRTDSSRSAREMDDDTRMLMSVAFFVEVYLFGSFYFYHLSLK